MVFGFCLVWSTCKLVTKNRLSERLDRNEEYKLRLVKINGTRTHSVYFISLFHDWPVSSKFD